MQQDINNQLSELRSTLGKMEVALGSISDAIVWTDHTGRIQWCNALFDNLIKSPHIAILGKNLVELLPLKEHGTLLPDKGHPVCQVLERETDISGYFEFAGVGGTLNLEVLGRHLEIAGSDRSAVFAIRDITHFKQLEQVKLRSNSRARPCIMRPTPSPLRMKRER
jgi:PAS domain-containing protein